LGTELKFTESRIRNSIKQQLVHKNWIQHAQNYVPCVVVDAQSKITNDGLTQYGTGCFIAVPIWQQ